MQKCPWNDSYVAVVCTLLCSKNSYLAVYYLIHFLLKYWPHLLTQNSSIFQFYSILNTTVLHWELVILAYSTCNVFIPIFPFSNLGSRYHFSHQMDKQRFPPYRYCKWTSNANDSNLHHNLFIQHACVS